MTQQAPTDFTSADFFDIKENLKSYLGTLTEFKDFNFEGSAINILLDALAYACNYQAVHANMAISEVFLDTCQLRSSAVSRSKELSYFPRQITSSKAFVRLEYSHPTLQTGCEIYLREGARFSSRKISGEKALEFVTFSPFKFFEEQDNLGNLINPGKYVCNVEIHEGRIVSQTFNFPSSFINSLPRFEILDKGVDTDYFKVTVTPPGDVSSIWSVSKDVTILDGDSQVFFLQESSQGNVEFYFGDGVIGKTPVAGSQITVSYLLTSGPEGNGAFQFDLDSEDAFQVSPVPVDPIPLNDISTVQQGRSNYGSDRQPLDSIKFVAPRVYASQNRAVTAADYQALLLREFGFIETMSVWGGEHNNPPDYGKVFVAIKPVNGTILSPGIKAQVQQTVLDRYSVVGLIPQIVDPEYTYIRLNSVITYDRSRTLKTESQLNEAVRRSVESFFRKTVSKFDSVFRFSNLCTTIDTSEPSILGSENEIVMSKKFVPNPFQEVYRTFNFGNQIVPSTVRILPFRTTNSDLMFISDSEGSGFLHSFLNGSIVKRNVGTVDYETGVVTLTSFGFPVTDNTEITLIASPGTQDIYALRNNLIVLDTTSFQFSPYYRVNKLDQTTTSK